MSVSSEPAAIFVLGGRVAPGGRATSLLTRRIEAGVGAARRWSSALVVACGGRAWEGAIEADVIARGLVAGGIDRDRVACDRVSFTTLENLREGAAIARSRGKMGRFAIVTCDWHLPRALAIAKRLGISALGVPAASGAPSLTTRLMRALHEAIALRLDLARVRTGIG
jgi:uncharacterized SAM-binding protein YcdF (DUF218 family)